ncbi:Nucleolar RNA helicase 2 [Globomyces sp. JEL0801]|nr:Nucleolar RNA helicase 2 [Globomyces sp. JEL0801]
MASGKSKKQKKDKQPKEEIAVESKEQETKPVTVADDKQQDGLEHEALIEEGTKEMNESTSKKKKKKVKSKEESVTDNSAQNATDLETKVGKNKRKKAQSKSEKSTDKEDIEIPGVIGVKRSIEEDSGLPSQKKVKKIQNESIVIADQHIDDYKKINADKEEIPENLQLSSLSLSKSTLDALTKKGITRLFPIQAGVYQHVLDGKDMFARARTGTGKTLAYALPMVEKLKAQKEGKRHEFQRRGRPPHQIILTPTRELAIQVHRELVSIALGELQCLCVYGGSTYEEQLTILSQGVDIVIGTPGRMIDHIDNGRLNLSDVEIVCLDEADQMLDIGFQEHVERILGCIKEQKSTSASALQILLFSATMPAWIHQVTDNFMQPDKVTIDLIGTDNQQTSALVTHYCLPSKYQNRPDILGDIAAVYGRGHSGKTIVFVETKAEATELVLNSKIVALGAQALHGDIHQSLRETTMQGFRDGKFSCLITTNVCARGVDIPEVDLVINCEPPDDIQTYIHRSGRTGRAGKEGICITFYKDTQLQQVERIRQKAGVDFIKIFAPQPKEIIAAIASQKLADLKDVDVDVLPYFENAAKEMLAHFNGDIEKSLQCALAMLCNTFKPISSRSLLTANNGFVTLYFSTSEVINNIGYIANMLKSSFPSLDQQNAVGWRLTADYMGVVVDFPESDIKVENADIYLAGQVWIDKKGIFLCIPTELPELSEFNRFGTQSGRGMFNFRGGRGSHGMISTRGGRGNQGMIGTRGGRGNQGMISTRGSVASRGGSRGRGTTRGNSNARGRGGNPAKAGRGSSFSRGSIAKSRGVPFAAGTQRS